jgi:hypothetical protein
MNIHFEPGRVWLGCWPQFPPGWISLRRGATAFNALALIALDIRGTRLMPSLATSLGSARGDWHPSARDPSKIEWPGRRQRNFAAPGTAGRSGDRLARLVSGSRS